MVCGDTGLPAFDWRTAAMASTVTWRSGYLLLANSQWRCWQRKSVQPARHRLPALAFDVAAYAAVDVGNGSPASSSGMHLVLAQEAAASWGSLFERDDTRWCLRYAEGADCLIEALQARLTWRAPVAVDRPISRARAAPEYLVEVRPQTTRPGGRKPMVRGEGCASCHGLRSFSVPVSCTETPPRVETRGPSASGALRKRSGGNHLSPS